MSDELELATLRDQLLAEHATRIAPNTVEQDALVIDREIKRMILEVVAHTASQPRNRFEINEAEQRIKFLRSHLSHDPWTDRSSSLTRNL